MDSDMARAHGHHYDQDPLHPVEGGVEEVPEKTSMFKRMKAKARKVKDSIGNKMHSGHSNDGPGQVHDHEEEEEEEEEGVQSPQGHGAPVYDSERSRNFAIGQEGKPSGAVTEEADQNVCPGTFQTKVTEPLHHDPPSAIPPKFGAEDSKPKVSSGEDYPSEPKHQPRDVYETDLTEPKTVSSEEAKVDPISSSFAKMGIHGDQQHDSSGSHDDQISSSAVPDFVSDKANTIPENAEAVPPVPASYSPKTGSHPQDMDVDISYPKDVDVDAHNVVDTADSPAPTANQGGYMSSAASAAISAKNAVASRFGYGGNEEKSSDVPTAGFPVGSTDDAVTDRSPATTPQPQSGYIESAKNAVASRLGYGGSDDTPKVESETRAIDDTKSPGERIGADDVVTDRSPITTPQPQSGYFESAKNAVASSLGYGGIEDTREVESETSRGIDDTKYPGEETGTDDVVTDRSPVTTPQPQSGYLESAKNAVASKLGYGASDDTATAGSETTRDLDDVNAPAEPETKKGVTGYISEKLKPGEDDKALSDYISGAYNKPKDVDTEEKSGMGQKVSEAFHKRNDDEDVDVDKPMGKVTESDQVANRLGSSESERTGVPSTGAESPGTPTGMVGKVKGAFTSWFGKGEEASTSPHSPVHGTTEEPHLQKEGGENVSYDEERKH